MTENTRVNLRRCRFVFKQNMMEKKNPRSKLCRVLEIRISNCFPFQVWRLALLVIHCNIDLRLTQKAQSSALFANLTQHRVAALACHEWRHPQCFDNHCGRDTVQRYGPMLPWREPREMNFLICQLFAILLWLLRACSWNYQFLSVQQILSRSTRPRHRRIRVLKSGRVPTLSFTSPVLSIPLSPLLSFRPSPVPFVPYHTFSGIPCFPPIHAAIRS